MSETATPARNVLTDSEKFRLGRYLDKFRSAIEQNTRDTIDTLAATIGKDLGFTITPSNLRSALEAAEIDWPASARVDGQLRRLWVELRAVQARVAELEAEQERDRAAWEEAISRHACPEQRMSMAADGQAGGRSNANEKPDMRLFPSGEFVSTGQSNGDDAA